MYHDATLPIGTNALVGKDLPIETKIMLSTLRRYFGKERPERKLTDLGVICRTYVEYHLRTTHSIHFSYLIRVRLREEYEYIHEGSRLSQKHFLRTVYDWICVDDDNDELDRPPKKPTRAEIFRRIEVMNGSIKSWATRPHLPPPPLPIPQRKQFTYYAGRGRDHGDVLQILGERFNTADKREIFLQSFALLCPTITSEVHKMIVQTLQDFEDGAPLPCFVLAAYCKSV
jgi:hypothetical protein